LLRLRLTWESWRCHRQVRRANENILPDIDIARFAGNIVPRPDLIDPNAI